MLNQARLVSQTVEIPKDTDIDVSYRGPYRADPEFVVIDYQLTGGQSVQFKVAPEAAVRLYGGIGGALAEKDRCDAARAHREELQRQREAEECKTVGERES